MVAILFPKEDLEGSDHTLSFKVELGVLILTCHRTNIMQKVNPICWNIHISIKHVVLHI